MNNNQKRKPSGFQNLLTDVKNFFTNGEPSVFKTIGKDKGEIGEFRCEYVLNNSALTNICTIKTVHNVYLKENGMSTEIDVVAITEKGIFVVESKNYGGKIYGVENAAQWNQYFSNGEKYKFYNPIKQNRSHIRKLASFLSLDKDYFVSYIVFSNRCKLVKVPKSFPDLKIIYREQLLWFVKYELERRETIFSEEQCNIIYKKLTELTKVTTEEKNQHIKQVKDIQENIVCPYCGKELIKRNGRYGEFYGCSGYPNCHYIKKVSS